MPDLETAARSLTEHGHDLAGGRARVLVTRSGVVVGFPVDPFVHVSWSAVAAGGLLVLGLRRWRSAR